MQFQVTPEFVNKLDAILSKGIVTGLGKPEPGQFCVEAAIAYALGESHCDKPSCVATPDRELMIKLNDAYPGTPQERAAALRDLAIAHLGTVGKDRTKWATSMVMGTIRVILPMALEGAASVHPDVVHQAAMRSAAQRCAKAENSTAAAAAARAARVATDDAADSATYSTSAAANAAYSAAAARSARSAARSARSANAANAAASDYSFDHHAAADAVDAADAAATAAARAAAYSSSSAAAYAYAARAASDTNAANARKKVLDAFIAVVLEAYRSDL